MLPEAARGEPDDVGVDRDLDNGSLEPTSGRPALPLSTPARAWSQVAGGELAQALPLARDPGAVAEGLVDGLGGGADGGLDVLPWVVVQLGEVAALHLEDLGELADVELGGVAVNFRDLSDQYSEHGIELVKGNAEDCLVC